MSIRRHVIVLTMTVVVIVGTFVATLLGDDRPVLGLDLQGGISIVLVPVEGSDTSALDAARDIIDDRVAGLGISEPEVQRQGNTIVVDLPGVKEREKAQELVGDTAELRFRLVQGALPWTTAVPETTTLPETTTVPGDPTATTVPGDTTPTTAGADTTTTVEGESAGVRIDAQPIAAVRPAQTDTTQPAAAPDTTPTTVAGDPTATSVPTESTTTTTFALPEAGDTCRDLVATREENLAEATVWLPGRDGDDPGSDPDECYLLGPAIMTGRDIDTASRRFDQNTGGYIVDVTFDNDDFATKVAAPNVGQQVAIELDGIVQSAPVINEGITGREVTISGDFTKGEAGDLALVLKYGALPVQFDPEEQTVDSVSPTLGKDQLRAGIVAGIVGLALVALYMIFYYRLLGLVVWVGLGLTGLLFFTITSYLSENQGLTLTLAGVTGLIVSVGVTVDSYVVFFERLKDEVRTGKTVRSSLDVGFRRAFRTIFAADLVSLLGAVVLYWLAAGSVRGFAFFLGLSTVIDLVIAYFLMYPLVVLMARRPALVRMRGFGIASGLDVRGVTA